MISPGEFVPVLEMCKLIYKLDLYVLDQIIQKMKEQQEAGLPVIPHSLNLSRIDFDECDIIDEILKRVDRAGIPREKLNIEITESVVGSDFDFIKEQIERLQDLGFHVWMDDFGSGYSSLDVLQDIHFDLIKFDMRFMHRFGKGKENKIILTQLFKMATELGIDTVAEGVETREQVEFLKEVGCTRLQGFYYNRAIPAEEIKEKYETFVLDRMKEID
jgi:EAL domain-containing protein (putative c-di-GMP-specific phosphodiesterase class I)